MARFGQAIPELDWVARGERSLNEVARMTWLWRGASQACVSCLAQQPSTWLLEWRLPWTFDCPIHGCLLATHCPVCSRLLTEGHNCLSQPRLIPTLAGTRGFTGQIGDCDEVGSRIRAALAGSPIPVSSGTASPAQYLKALRALSGLIEHMERGRTTDRPPMRRAVAAAPREPIERARLLSLADDLLQQSPVHAAQQLVPLLDRVSIDGMGVRTWLRDHTLRTSLIEPIIENLGDTRRTIGRVRMPEPCAVESARVPQLIWPQAWLDLRPYIRSSEATGRCFASMALVKMATGHTWAAVGDTLGLPPHLAHHVARKGKGDLLDQRAFTANLINLRPVLDIDWRHRERQALALMDDESTLIEIARAIGAAHVELCLLRERIWNHWAEGHPFIPLTTWPASKTQRARAANQRRRWRPENSVRLQQWLDGRYAASPAGAAS